VVDPDPAVADDVAAALRPGHDHVDVRFNAREALDALRDEQYDLVLCDVAAAQGEDFSFPRIARRTHSGIAIILTTIDEEGYPFSEALTAGVDGYISKPVTPQKLTLLFQCRYWQALSREDWWQLRCLPPH
jgi:CheY-like chemotaxis protein